MLRHPTIQDEVVQGMSKEVVAQLENLPKGELHVHATLCYITCSTVYGFITEHIAINVDFGLQKEVVLERF